MATVRDAAELARDVPRTVPKIAKRGGRRRSAQRRRRPRTSWRTKEEETTSGRSSEGATLFRAPNAGDAAARSGPVRPARRGRQRRRQTMTRGALTVDNDRGPLDGEGDGHAPCQGMAGRRGSSSATSTAGAPGGRFKRSRKSRCHEVAVRPDTAARLTAEVGSAPCLPGSIILDTSYLRRCGNFRHES
ncbi:hypothetical protein HPB50_024739 [Hyalomma asiaticum]|uniref:Uncharacterized protein n=1 Tax=Hyalomma asiaticum TaxID=266040 RepID=A0ACB7SI06_HYAAI|nr:hypothetical protein HPB50_024739 [Hyalomma asiaticum]